MRIPAAVGGAGADTRAVVVGLEEVMEAMAAGCIAEE